MFGLERKKKVKKAKVSGSSPNASLMYALGVLGGFALLLYGIFAGSPVPSDFTWQFILGGYQILIVLAATSGIYVFKAKSPQMVGRNHHNSMDRLKPVGTAKILTNGKPVINDIFVPGGFRAFSWYSHGNRKNGIAVVPDYFWVELGEALVLAADPIPWPFDGFPPSVQNELKNSVKGFDPEKSDIYWYILPNNLFRYIIKIHSKDNAVGNIHDILAMFQMAENQYTDLVRRYNSSRQVFKLEDRFLNKGRSFKLKSKPEEERYIE